MMKAFIRTLNYLNKYHTLSLYYYNSTTQHVVPLVPAHSLLSLLLRRVILPTYQGIQGSNPPLPHQLLQPGWSVSLGQLYTYHESMFFLPTSRIWQQELYRVLYCAKSTFNGNHNYCAYAFWDKKTFFSPSASSAFKIIMKSITTNSKTEDLIKHPREFVF